MRDYSKNDCHGVATEECLPLFQSPFLIKENFSARNVKKTAWLKDLRDSIIPNECNRKADDEICPLT